MNNLNTVFTCLIKVLGLHQSHAVSHWIYGFSDELKLHGFVCTSGILSIVILMRFRVKERERKRLERSYQHINNGCFPFLLKILAFYLSAPCRTDHAVSVWRKHNLCLLFLLQWVSFWRMQGVKQNCNKRNWRTPKASEHALNWTSYHHPFLCIDHSEMCRHQARLNRCMNSSFPRYNKVHSCWILPNKNQLKVNSMISSICILVLKKDWQDLSASLWR